MSVTLFYALLKSLLKSPGVIIFKLIDEDNQ